MFIEVNEIKCFIFNIDGFFQYSELSALPRDKVWSVITDEVLDKVKLLPELFGLIDIIKDKYPFRFVSKVSLEQVTTICGSNSFAINADHIFTAQGEFEKGNLFYEPIKRARDDMSMLSCHSVYITAEENTIDKALKLHMGTMIFRYSAESIIEEELIYRRGADFILESLEDLEKILSKTLIGYLTEIHSSPEDMRPYSSAKQYIQILEIPNQDMPDNKLFVGGRYLPVEDSRHSKHALSIRLTNSKYRPERHIKLFSRILRRSADWVAKEKYDLITQVPSRVAGTADRFKMFLEQIPIEFKDFDKSKIAPNLIKCIREYMPQKMAGSYENRKRNVKDAFEVTGDVSGKIIVVVDDIATSGATLYEITRILIEAGCKKVYPVALALTVSGKVANGEAVLYCEKCHGRLVPRCGVKEGYVFWGCENFHDKREHTMIKFSKGVKILNEKTSPPEREIPAELDIPF